MSVNDARLAQLAAELGDALREERIASKMDFECSSERMRIEKEIEEASRKEEEK